MQREQAWSIVEEFTESITLKRHMLAVEVAMRAYAPRFGGDPELWGTVGLVHDFDYEQNPGIDAEGHPIVGGRILKERGVSEEIVRAVLAHSEATTGIKPESDMEKTLVAVDELTGFIVAVALVRPSKSVLDVKPKSIRKKWKSAAFAAAVDRQEIEHAAEALGVPLNEHIQIVLDAMKEHAKILGLAGS
jgi:putative nucleotidyltransferase with HDIG domain